MKLKTSEHFELAEIRKLAEAVLDKHGRAWAVSIIIDAGEADSLADVATANYPALRAALIAKLHSSDDPDSQPKLKGFTRSAPEESELRALGREFYKERLHEIGRLAAALDADPGHPIDTILRFFEIDDIDKKTVLKAYHLQEKTSG